MFLPMSRYPLLFFLLFSFAASSQEKREIDSLEKLLPSSKQDTNLARILFTLCNNYHDLDPSKALIYGRQGLELSTQLGYKKGMSACNNNLGMTYEVLGDLPRALEYYLLSLKIKEEMKDKKGMAGSLNNIGIVCHRQLDNDNALKYYKQALEINHSIGNKKWEAINYYNIGVVYKEREEYSKALEAQNAALKLRQEINDQKGIANSLLALGNIYGDRGNTPLSIEYYLRSIRINAELKNRSGVAYCYLNIGNRLIHDGRYNDALDYEEKALAIGLETSDLKLQQKSYYNLAVIYDNLSASATGPLKKALEYYKLYMQRNDTLLNKEKIMQMSEMSVKYETEKKESEIKLLNIENEKKELEMEREKAEQASQRIFFISLFVILITLTIGILLIVRSRRVNEKIKMNAELKELEHQALRLQMNPHFIFNSLSSINNFIGKSETAEAKKFLTKFAKLMRLILENSREEFIPIQEEIDSLSYYIELEQLRFGNKFSFEILVDPSIDAENTLIPPMLIQPHVENAILHGLAAKDGPGRICIRFKPADELIVCEVEDDGIGRKRSAELNEKSGLQHHSMAMKITQERLSILFPGKRKHDIIVEDLVDKSGDPLGTKLSFTLVYRRN